MSAQYEVCPKCEGRGTAVNPVLSVWTESDRYDDPEGFERMLAGDYDVICPRCNGLRVVSQESEEDFRERVEDAHTRAWESGDRESIANGYWREGV